jgi:hypothetical protein
MSAPPPPGPPRPDKPVGAPPSGVPPPSDEARAPKAAVDLHATPSGLRPVAWKDLPPPEIVRATPEEPKKGAEGLRESARKFLRTRAALQVGIGLGAAVLLVAAWLFFQPRATLNSHYGALRLFTRALEARDLAAMQRATTGPATTMCADVLATITEMEREAKASRFARATYNVGGAPAGTSAVSATVTCRGVSGDAFLQVDMNLVRQADGTWRIAELGTRPLR